jgi:hypothetical protein
MPTEKALQLYGRGDLRKIPVRISNEKQVIFIPAGRGPGKSVVAADSITIFAAAAAIVARYDGRQ